MLKASKQKHSGTGRSIDELTAPELENLSQQQWSKDSKDHGIIMLSVTSVNVTVPTIVHIKPVICDACMAGIGCFHLNLSDSVYQK